MTMQAGDRLKDRDESRPGVARDRGHPRQVADIGVCRLADDRAIQPRLARRINCGLLLDPIGNLGEQPRQTDPLPRTTRVNEQRLEAIEVFGGAGRIPWGLPWNAGVDQRRIIGAVKRDHERRPQVRDLQRQARQLLRGIP